MIYRSICCRDLHLHGFPGPGSKDNSSKLLYFINDPSSLFPIMPDTFPIPAIAMDQAPTVPKQIDYSSFPPEIRNKIIDFALRPGHIHPPYTRSGVQILATNRQHYKIGHVTYYSDNIFHMPHGDSYKDILQKYRPEHRNLSDTSPRHAASSILTKRQLLHYLPANAARYTRNTTRCLA